MWRNWDDLRVFLGGGTRSKACQRRARACGLILRHGAADARLEEAMGRAVCEIAAGLRADRAGSAAGAGEAVNGRCGRHATGLSAHAKDLRADPYRGAGWLRQLPVAAGLRAHCARIIPIWISRSSLCRALFNLSRREADMAIGVSAPTSGRLSCAKDH